MGFLKPLIDTIYGTSGSKRKFLARFPNDRIITADSCKGVKTDQVTDLSRGTHWAFSRRGTLVISDKRINFCDWEIPISEIEHASLQKFRQGIFLGYVLKIKTTDNGNYQFGMQINKKLLEQKVIPLQEEKVKLKSSPLQIILRVTLLLLLLYLLFKRFYGTT